MGIVSYQEIEQHTNKRNVSVQSTHIKRHIIRVYTQSDYSDTQSRMLVFCVKSVSVCLSVSMLTIISMNESILSTTAK